MVLWALRALWAPLMLQAPPTQTALPVLPALPAWACERPGMRSGSPTFSYSSTSFFWSLVATMVSGA